MLIRRALTVVLAALLLWTGAALAQTFGPVDYGGWDRFATQAEDRVEDGSLSNTALADMRTQVVQWRDQFQAGQNVNATRVATLRDQIQSLGPAPAEGETEDPEVAARRATLNEQLAEAQAPRLTAVEAFSRADALVRSIDTLKNQRQASERARLSPSPLNPANWVMAGSEAVRLSNAIIADTGRRFAGQGGWTGLGQQLPTVLAYLVAAAVLLTYGRRWIDSLPSRMSAQASEHSRAVLAFVVSLGQIAVPLIGVFLLVSALDATGFFGPWTRPALQAMPVAGLIFFGGRWITRQVFPRVPIAYATLNMPDDKRNAVRFIGLLLAGLTALRHIVASVILPLSGMTEAQPGAAGIPGPVDEAAASVWYFTLILPAALLLFRLGNILRRLVEWDGTGQPAYRLRILTLCGRLSRLIAVVAVLAAAAGFVTAANVLVWPWAMSLALICLLILLQDFASDLFEMFAGGKEGARDGLGPVLVGFALVLLSVPVFALIWGMRPSDLAELWGRIRQGVSLGGVTLSPGIVATFLIVFGIGYMATRFVQGVVRNTVLPKTRLDQGGQNALVSGLGYLGIFLAALLAITSAGIDLSSLAIVAGALSVGIGFGLQNIVSNFVSGIILLIERPVGVGDWIRVGAAEGYVRRISIRSTQIETFDRTDVIVPNSDLIAQPVTNWTRGSAQGRIIVPVSVAYGTDTRKVAEVLREIAEDQPTVLIDPPPSVLFTGFSTDGLDFEIRAILSDITGGLGVRSEVRHQIVQRFAAEGIEMPFAQSQVWLRNPEALTLGAPDAGMSPLRGGRTPPGLDDDER